MSNFSKLATVGELLAEPPEEVPFIVDELLPAGGVSLLLGAPKAGKSTFLLWLVVALAQLGIWLGRGCIGGGAILFAFEEKRHHLREALRRLGAQPDDPILVYTGQPMIPEYERPQDWLERMVFGPDSKRIPSPPVLVVVDTLARLVRIRDGNDYHEVTDALAGIIELARVSKTHIMLAHHARKGGNGNVEFGEEALGSTALLGSVDTAISIRRDHATGARMVYSVNRYGTDIPLSFLTRDAETGAVSLGVSKADAAAERHEADILDFVAAQAEPLTITEIVAAEGVSGNAQAIRAAVKRLAKAGRLSLTEGARRGSWKYSVPHCTGAD